MRQTKWFTFVELIVATTILVILTTLWFYSYSQYLLDARDSQRKSDLASISSSLKLYKQKRGSYPLPWESFPLTFGSIPVATHWKLNSSVTLSTLDKLPFDPLLKIPYIYSITTSKQEYQIWATLENNWNGLAYLEWTYKTVSRDNLPTIIMATGTTSSLEVSISTNKNTFIFHNQSKNLPYDLETWIPFANGTSFANLINDGSVELWQNSDYRSCTEIYESGKSIGTWTYQIVNASWSLVNITCNVNASWALY